MYAARAASGAPIAELALWVPDMAGHHPCGLCLQTWLELAPDARFHLQRGSGEVRALDLRELLPDAFRSFEANT
jgi:cytidine deaminase